MKKLFKRIERSLTGTINTDYKPSIGTPSVRTVSEVKPVLQGAKQYTTPFN